MIFIKMYLYSNIYYFEVVYYVNIFFKKKKF